MTTHEETKRKPATTLRDRPLKATVWKNEGENGSWYSTSFTRTYRTEQGFQDTDSFRASDLLPLARLAGRVYDAITDLDDAERAASSEQNGGRE